MNVVVMISGHGGNLQAIIDANLPITLCAVVSDQPHAYGLQRATQHGIPTHVVEKEKKETRTAYAQRLLARITPLQPDLIVLAGFMRILDQTFVQHFENKIINIHPSLLPKFKGLDTHQRALDAKETEHGCTVHTVTAELDDGPILAQARCTIAPDETAETLQTKVRTLEHRLYPTVIQRIATHRELL